MTNSEQTSVEASAKKMPKKLGLLAALLDRGYAASKVNFPYSEYDLIVELSPDSDDQGTEPQFIRIVVKTVGSKGQISFRGTARGGRNRPHGADASEYTHSTETADIVIGVEQAQDNGDHIVNYYFIPTLYIETLGKRSTSVRTLKHTKNRWDVLPICRDPAAVRRAFARSSLAGLVDIELARLD